MENENLASNIGKYEITFILDENSKAESVLKLFENIEHEELKDLGIKKFAYKIGKTESGHYFGLVFKLKKTKLQEIEKELKLEKEIIRHLIVSVSHEKIKALHEQKQAARNMKKAAEAMAQTAKAEEKAKQNKEEKPAEKEKTVKAPAEIKKIVKPAAAKEEKIEEKTEAEASTSEKVGMAAKSVEKKPKAVKKPKTPRITQAELDKKLEELVED